MSIVKDKFDNLEIIESPKYNQSVSVKTNFLNAFKITRLLNIRLQIVIDYCKELTNLIDIENIVNLVLANLNENKLQFLLNYQLPINTSDIITVKDTVYKITRINNNTFSVEKDTGNWNVERLGGFCKTLDGVVIYPKIQTIQNKINIIFSEPPNENNNLYIM